MSNDSDTAKSVDTEDVVPNEPLVGEPLPPPEDVNGEEKSVWTDGPVIPVRSGEKGVDLGPPDGGYGWVVVAYELMRWR